MESAHDVYDNLTRWMELYIKHCFLSEHKCKTQVVNNSLHLDYADLYHFTVQLLNNPNDFPELKEDIEIDGLPDREPPIFPPEEVTNIALYALDNVVGADALDVDDAVVVDLPLSMSVTEMKRTVQSSDIYVKVTAFVVHPTDSYFWDRCKVVQCTDNPAMYIKKCADFWASESATSIKFTQQELEALECERRTTKYEEVKVTQFSVADPPELASSGTPSIVTVYSLGKQVELSTGDLIELIGIVRGKKRRGIREITLEYIMHRPLKQTETAEVLNTEVVTKLHRLKFPDNFFHLLVSYEPLVFGWWTVKAHMLALSVLKPQFVRFGNNKVLSTVPLLLAGDPEVGKSSLGNTLIEYIVPSTRVKASSATEAGLTFAVEVDPTTGQRVYRAGTLIMNDGGVVVVEELSSNPQIAKALYLVMENGEISRSTAGGTIRVPVRTWLVFVTNPSEGKWNDALSVSENLKFVDEAFLSRTILFIMRDTRQHTEMKLTQRLITTPVQEIYEDLTFTREEVKHLITYLRKLPNPVVGADARKVLDEWLDSIRGKLPISPREIIHLLLVATGIAKIDFSDEVKEQHMRLALFLLHHRIMMNHGEHLPSVVGATPMLTPDDAELRVKNCVLDALKQLCRTGSKFKASDVAKHMRSHDADCYNIVKAYAKKYNYTLSSLVKRMLDAMFEEGLVVKDGSTYCVFGF